MRLRDALISPGRYLLLRTSPKTTKTPATTNIVVNREFLALTLSPSCAASAGNAENSSASSRAVKEARIGFPQITNNQFPGAGTRWTQRTTVLPDVEIGFKASHLARTERSVVPLEMVFRVRRSYSGKRQSATYRPACAELEFECLVEAQEYLAEF
jgi:hypothetical protein